MKKTVFSLLAATSLIGAVAIPTTTLAASQDECSIWLCLPGGFPNGCGGAKSAMKHRLKKGKSPLPSFASCAVKSDQSDPEDFTYTFNRVIKIEKHKVCTKWKEGRDTRTCLDYKTVPEHYKQGDSCYKNKKDDIRIKGCVGVFREIKVFEKGQLLGKPYYF